MKRPQSQEPHLGLPCGCSERLPLLSKVLYGTVVLQAVAWLAVLPCRLHDCYCALSMLVETAAALHLLIVGCGSCLAWFLLGAFFLTYKNLRLFEIATERGLPFIDFSPQWS